jgi:diguanylate cyclase (GGDEF)-like protein
MMRKTYHISSYLAWLTLVPLLALAVSMALFFLHDRFRSLDNNLQMRGDLIAHQLANSSEYGVYANNLVFLQNIGQGVLEQADVDSVTILNEQGVVLVDISRKNRGQAEQENLAISRPINATQVALDEFENKPLPQQIGAVTVGMSWAHTHTTKLRLLWSAAIATLLFLMLVLYLVYLTSRRIAMPIAKLSSAIADMGEGNLSVRVAIDTRINELATLAQGINNMAAQLQSERMVLQQRIDAATLQLKSLAFYDTLTQLPNRRMLEDRLAHAIAVSNRSGQYAAIMFIDLDNFKPLNDLHGHGCGDLLLVEAARRIGSCVRMVDTVARFGGDEFVVLISQLTQDAIVAQNEAMAVANKICHELALPYTLSTKVQGHTQVLIAHQCTSSIGIAVFLDDNLSQDEILMRADKAMYQAKSSGRNQACLFSADAEKNQD